MNTEVQRKYICKDCGWTGTEKELDFDEVETCMGGDETEMCPQCGSLNVHFLSPDS